MFKSFDDLRNFNILKIYKGKDNHCRCGCGGKYYYPENRSFDRILKNAEKAFNENLKLMEENHNLPTCNRNEIEYPVETGEGYLNIPIWNKENQCYCIYFNEK